LVEHPDKTRSRLAVGHVPTVHALVVRLAGAGGTQKLDPEVHCFNSGAGSEPKQLLAELSAVTAPPHVVDDAGGGGIPAKLLNENPPDDVQLLKDGMGGGANSQLHDGERLGGTIDESSPGGTRSNTEGTVGLTSTVVVVVLPSLSVVLVVVVVVVVVVIDWWTTRLQEDCSFDPTPAWFFAALLLNDEVVVTDTRDVAGLRIGMSNIRVGAFSVGAQGILGGGGGTHSLDFSCPELDSAVARFLSAGSLFMNRTLDAEFRRVAAIEALRGEVFFPDLLLVLTISFVVLVGSSEYCSQCDGNKLGWEREESGCAFSK
jgi:hypothetical protein